jgi:hypothetical protein
MTYVGVDMTPRVLITSTRQTYVGKRCYTQSTKAQNQFKPVKASVHVFYIVHGKSAYLG